MLQSLQYGHVSQKIKGIKMAQHGGTRPGAGRKPGAVSQAKRELAEMAKGKAEQALNVLAEIMLNGESEAARVSAANAILDRGYGKPFQSVQISGDEESPVHTVQHIVIDPPSRE